MSQVKFNFLNWQPDREDYENDGLITADNLIHQPEGYTELLVNTVGSASTLTALAGTTFTSINMLPMGSARTVTSSMYMVGAVQGSATASSLVAIEPGGSTLSIAGQIDTTSTLLALTNFDVCELNNSVVVIGMAVGEGASATRQSASILAHMTAISA